MKLTYNIRQKIGYYDVTFEAHDELEMVCMLKTLLKGNPRDNSDKYSVTVTVEYEEDEPEQEEEAPF